MNKTVTRIENLIDRWVPIYNYPNAAPVRVRVGSDLGIDTLVVVMFQEGTWGVPSLHESYKPGPLRVIASWVIESLVAGEFITREEAKVFYNWQQAQWKSTYNEDNKRLEHIQTLRELGYKVEGPNHD